MKHLLLIITAGILSAIWCTAKAQTLSDFSKMPAQQKAQLITDSLRATLRLSATQVNKVHTQLLADLQKLETLSYGNESRRGRREEMRAFLAAEEVKLQKILTPEQYALFKTKKENALKYYRTHLLDRKVVFNVPQQN